MSSIRTCTYGTVKGLAIQPTTKGWSEMSWINNLEQQGDISIEENHITRQPVIAGGERHGADWSWNRATAEADAARGGGTTAKRRSRSCRRTRSAAANAQASRTERVRNRHTGSQSRSVCFAQSTDKAASVKLGFK